MDLLQSYTGNDSDSDTTDGTPSPPTRATKRRIKTGTLETIALSNDSFNTAQRVFDNTLSHGTPPTSRVAKRPRPRSTPPPTPPPPSTSSAKPPSSATPPSALLPTTTFHLPASHDYQHRPWHHPPPTSRTFADLETYTPFIPKLPVFHHHTHSKPAATVIFSRPHGNLLLSAGLDAHANVFDVATRSLARKYSAHSAGIRHADFHHSAETFLTGGYDRRVVLWSTETGRVAASFRTSGIPSCVAFVPGCEHQFLVACSDRRVLQLDVRDANHVVQTYDQHMGAVNALAFIDQGRRFVSSADDKVLRVWEYGVPVVIKYVTDPSMHSMPVLKLHPNQRSLACQSMDNTVRVYTARDKFKRNDKKLFKGQLVAGYACGLTFSPDGRFLASGDSMGRLFFWDWKTTRLFRTLQAHKGVCIALDWHPTLPSLVASCGWDGSVKLWD